MIFLKLSRRDTSQQSVQWWNWKSPECWSTFVWRRELHHDDSVIRMPQERLVRQVLLATPQGRRLRVRPRTMWRITSPTLLGPILV